MMSKLWRKLLSLFKHWHRWEVIADKYIVVCKCKQHTFCDTLAEAKQTKWRRNVDEGNRKAKYVITGRLD